jgi:tRNA G18 (ribose-2'-O)-methylase SpoU
MNEIRDVWALDAGGKSIADFNWPQNIRLLVGEEGPGIAENFPKNKTLSIPMAPQSESLNAMVALSLGLFSYCTKYPLEI